MDVKRKKQTTIEESFFGSKKKKDRNAKNLIDHSDMENQHEEIESVNAAIVIDDASDFDDDNANPRASMGQTDIKPQDNDWTVVESKQTKVVKKKLKMVPNKPSDDKNITLSKLNPNAQAFEPKTSSTRTSPHSIVTKVEASQSQESHTLRASDQQTSNAECDEWIPWQDAYELATLTIDRSLQRDRGSTMAEVDGMLASFGYRFNKNGELRNINSGNRFVFEARPGDQSYNQQNYESLGRVVDEYVYSALVERCGLRRLEIPIDRTSGEARSFIFISPDLSSYSKLLVLVHGSGAVRAGQWSRRLIINHSLNSGTQIPYIERGQRRGFAVLVMNSNQNRDVDGRNMRVRGSQSPEAHFEYVWRTFVESSSIKRVGIVAHSYGGAITVQGALRLPSVRKRVLAVAFTDSVHSVPRSVADGSTDSLLHWLQTRCRNWVSVGGRVGEVVRRRSENRGDCECVSAGTEVHEETSWKAFNDVWTFLCEKMNVRKTQNEIEDIEKSTDGSMITITETEDIVVINKDSEIESTQTGVDDSKKSDLSQQVHINNSMDQISLGRTDTEETEHFEL